MTNEQYAAQQRVRAKRYHRKQFFLWKDRAYLHFVANANKVLTSKDRDLIFIYTKTLHDLVNRQYGITFEGKSLDEDNQILFPIMLEYMVEKIMNKISKL